MAVASPVAATVDEQVLDAVAGLMAEVGSGDARRPRLDDLLDRDLGISSLERVELLLRLEQTFGVRLSDTVMADAATPRDLSSAIQQAARASPTAAPLRTHAAPAAAVAVPADARSLADVVRWHAERTPDRVHLWLGDEEGVETAITYGELLVSATAIGRGLRARGVGRGDRVALMLRTERAFFDVFLGSLLVGAIPVPLYPPMRTDDLVAYSQRQRAILDNAGARLLVTFDEAERLGRLLLARTGSLEAVVTPAQIAPAGPPPIFPRPDADDTAFIQYTSGSTGNPKGVVLSHANLLANIRAMGRAVAIDEHDVAVSWLPLYHDMGLIGLWLGALYFGAPTAIMSPLAFLARPARWLRAIHTHRGTISAAPNFAFDLCARAIRDEEIAGLDLRSWRVAIDGSEAVHPDTIDRFVQRFAPFGFSASAFCPAYGLAESSVGLTISPIGRAPRIDRIARRAFEARRELQPAAPGDAHALRFVSCGRPLPGHDVRIADRSGGLVAERVEGRIQFRGPSTTSGYFRNDEATAAAVHDGWMDTGDLGYLADGELFITGREKDLIIQGGRNICAEEVEAIAGAVPGIRANSVAAFGVPDRASGTERLVVIAETREEDAARRLALQRAVRDRLVEGIGSPPDVVVLASPGTVLKTSSGKIRRNAMRDAYVSGAAKRRRSSAEQRVALVAGAAVGFVHRTLTHATNVAFTAWVMLVLALSLPVLWVYLTLRGSGRHADHAAKRWSRVALRLCGLRPEVVGLERLEAVPSAIVVANHASYIDPVVLMAAIPVDFHFVAKRTLTTYPMIGRVIRQAEHLTVDKAALGHRLAGLQEIERSLQAGDRLVIFPEGTFVRAPGLLPFRLGAFRAAVETARPIVPVTLAGTRDVLPDETIVFRHGPIRVTIGEPIVPHAGDWQEIVRLRDAAVHQIAAG